MTQRQMAEVLDRSRESVSQRLMSLGHVGDRTQEDWALCGDKSPLWRGGSVSWNNYGCEWKRYVRPLVLRRDGGKCVLCDKTERLQVHHVVPFRETQDHSVENQVSLCSSHHKWADNCLPRELMQEALRTRDFDACSKFTPSPGSKFMVLGSNRAMSDIVG